MSNQTAERVDPAADDRDHLSSVEDGCGCVELWEALSERRSGDDDAA